MTVIIQIIMKHKMLVADFLEAAKITNYEEDLMPDIYYEHEDLSIDDIIHNLPKKYSKITAEQLAELPALSRSLECAINTASHDALIDECYKEQNKAVENYADKLVECINKIPEDDKVAVKSIFVDWKTDEVTIDFDVKNTLSVVREIINGEGMFVYDTDLEFAMIYDGKNRPTQAVIQHLHYLLNGKLINDIWGFSSRCNGKLDWECDYGYITEENIVGQLEDTLSKAELKMLAGKLSVDVIKAVELRHALDSKKEEVEDYFKKLETQLSSLSKEEMLEFKNLTENK